MNQKTDNFSTWLAGMQNRNSPVGDLARDMLSDNDWPKDGTDKMTFKRYLENQHACDGARNALETAWGSYRKARRKN
jgi:uncharacterized protein YozE (UPF0346 family)